MSPQSRARAGARSLARSLAPSANRFGNPVACECYYTDGKSVECVQEEPSGLASVDFWWEPSERQAERPEEIKRVSGGLPWQSLPIK